MAVVKKALAAFGLEEWGHGQQAVGFRDLGAVGTLRRMRVRWRCRLCAATSATHPIAQSRRAAAKSLRQAERKEQSISSPVCDTRETVFFSLAGSKPDALSS